MPRTRLPRRAGFLLVLLVFAVPVALVPTTGCGTGINLVSVEDEWQMGREIERDINAQVRLVNDATLQRYVEQMGQRIVRQTPMADRQWKFYVVQDPNINAFNAPGGLVYIYTGLIAQADNAAELAGVMAHEIAHGVARHGTQRLSQVYGLNVAASVLLGGDPGIAQQIAAQIVAGGAVASFSRGQEREADQLGVRYMAAAGYDPEGMATLLEKLIADRQRRPGAVEQFFSTHPLTEDRVADVRRMARGVQRQGLSMNDGQYANIKARAARY
jgi:beta-barrel assembly-enhancing protease